MTATNSQHHTLLSSRPSAPIMIVDDSAVDRMNLSKIVRDQGFDVIGAASAAECLEKAKTIQPSVIFLDIMMAGMDGFQACRLLKRDQQTQAIPVVMVSAKKNRADKVWASEQGASDYIEKPINPDRIAMALERFV